MIAAACLACFVLTLSAVLAAGYRLWLRQPAAVAAGGPRRVAGFGSDFSLGRWVEAIEWLGSVVPVRTSRREEAKRNLLAAGYRAPAGVLVYFGLKHCLAVAAPCLLCPPLYWIRPDPVAVGFAGTLAAYISFRLPSWLVGFAANARRKDIRHALPDLIEMLVIGVESGLSIDKAISEAARALGAAYPELTEELQLYQLELGAGTTRAEALRNLGRRTGEPHVRKFGSLLIQTERFGTGVARMLRRQARLMRLRRRQRAEELARQLGVKMIFPIFFLVLPSTFLVTAGPAMLYLFVGLRRMLGE